MKDFIVTILKAIQKGSFNTFDAFKLFFIEMVKGEVFKRALALLIKKMAFFGTGLGGFIAKFMIEYLWDELEPFLKTFINWSDYKVNKDVKGKFHWEKLEDAKKQKDWDAYDKANDDILNV